MKVSFSAYCVLTAVAAIALAMFMAPLMWDAAGYVAEILTVYPMGAP